jgi:hypothetical protein
MPSSTLSDSGCSYDGDSTPKAGPLTVTLANTASKDGSFAIGQIAAGSTIDDLEAYMARERGRIAAGKSVEGPPAFYEEDVRLSVPIGTESQLTADLLAGNSYALVCLTEDKKGQPLTLYVATPLVPSG